MEPLNNTNLSSSNPQSDGLSGGAAGAIGSVVAFVGVVLVVVFIWVAYSEYKKAQHLQQTQKTPISKSKIFKRAAIYALTFGGATWCCAEYVGQDDEDALVANPQDTGDSGGSGEGYELGSPMMSVATMSVPMPMPTYQPQMDWTPLDPSDVR
ncbi:hypothetical protein BP6252_05639 [Coleophoma cylindrospora]|uniref:Uncharacterized protein n=1 Tax=Coleophoma cylindrospora TaxID=1849047 RepID=A0A3D8RUD2_9HELO|nr:hypothetical protein BP6252_05639 [Coleophoma cylindrospora]